MLWLGYELYIIETENKFNLVMKVSSLFLAILISTNLSAELKSKLDRQIEELMPKVIEWRHDIHQHPELGNREFRTSKKIEEHLVSLGIELET